MDLDYGIASDRKTCLMEGLHKTDLDIWGFLEEKNIMSYWNYYNLSSDKLPNSYKWTYEKFYSINSAVRQEIPTSKITRDMLISLLQFSFKMVFLSLNQSQYSRSVLLDRTRYFGFVLFWVCCGTKMPIL